MKKHIFFDCFGTLINTGNGSINAVEQILSHINKDIEAGIFYSEWKRAKREMMYSSEFYSEKELFKMSLSVVFERYGITADSAKEVVPMINSLFDSRSVYPDVPAILKLLEDKKIEYAIASNTDNASLNYYLQANDLHFDIIFTSEDIKAYKPNDIFYERILHKSGWAPDECLFVGDNYFDDVCGPKNAGMGAVLVDRARKSDNCKYDIKPDNIIHSLNELAEMFPVPTISS